MLNLKFQHVLEEIRAAESARNRFTNKYPELLNQYEGGLRSGSADGLSNHAYEYHTLMGPRFAHDRPKAKVTTRRPGQQELVVQAIRHGLNRWGRDSDFGEILRWAAFDYAYFWACAIVHPEPMPGERTQGSPMWPVVECLDPRKFIMDPRATNPDEAVFVGHEWIRDKDDLVAEAEEGGKDAGWNVDAVKGLSTDSSRDLSEDGNSVTGPERNEVRGYTLWVPSYVDDEVGPEEGFHGCWLTLAADAETGDYLREPTPFYGPRWGPYVYEGAHITRSSPWTFGPLLATQLQQKKYNEMLQSILTSCSTYKRGVFFEKGGDPDAATKANTPGMYAIGLDNINESKPVPYEIGGISDQQLRMQAFFKQNLEETSGMDAAQRGVAEGGAPATEIALADKNAGVRVEGMKRPFTRFANQLYRTVAWYLYHDDRVEFALGEEAAEALGMQTPMFQGGAYEDGSGATYDDLEIEIEIHSMARSTEALHQGRVLQAFQMVTNTLPLRRQFPEADWKSLDSMLGDALNLPNLPDMVDQALANTLAGLQPTEQSQDVKQPRLNRDVGLLGAAQATRNELAGNVAEAV